MCHSIARRAPFILAISTFAFLAAISVAPAASAQATAAAHAPHWGYSGADSPSHWADLDPSFATCKTGKRQSPIDIKGATKDSSLAPIQIDYKHAPLKIVDNGHTIRVNVVPGSSITVNGTAYTLTQFHFHRPSEEEIAGKKYAMVIHLVNERAGGAAVIALLVKTGAENPTIQKIWDNLPKEKDKENEKSGGRHHQRRRSAPGRSELLQFRRLPHDTALQRRCEVVRNEDSRRNVRRSDRRIRQTLSHERASHSAH